MFSKLALRKHKYTLSLLEKQASMSFFSTNAAEKEKGPELKNDPETEKQEGFQNQEGRKINADPENPAFKKKFEIDYLKLLWRMLFWGTFGVFAYNYYLLKRSKNPFLELGYIDPFYRAAKWTDTKYTSFYNFMTKPPLEKLLPDFPSFPGMPDPPKTLVLNLSGTLIHTNYVFGKGAEIMKRPGLKPFLDKLGQMFEIVVFSDEDSMFTFSIAEKLDPKRMFLAGCFGRESTIFDNGSYVKDLRYLNRDLRKVVVLETNPERIKYQKENGIFLKEFTGSKDDKALFELLPFLEYCARPDVKDIRAELNKYGHEEPGKKFLEELKARQKSLSDKQNKGVAGFLHGMASKSNVNPNLYSKKI